LQRAKVISNKIFTNIHICLYNGLILKTKGTYLVSAISAGATAAAADCRQRSHG